MKPKPIHLCPKCSAQSTAGHFCNLRPTKSKSKGGKK